MANFKLNKSSVYGGEDLAPLVQVYWSLLLEHPEASCLHTRLPKVHFASNRNPDSYSGVAKFKQHEVRLRIGQNIDKVAAMETLLHELAHLACSLHKEEEPLLETYVNAPWGSRERENARSALTAFRKKHIHGQRFRRILVDTAVKIWGEKVRVSTTVEGRCYQLDDLLQREIRKALGLPWVRGSWIKDQEPVEEPVHVPVVMTLKGLREMVDGQRVVVKYSEDGREFTYTKASGEFVAGCSSYSAEMLFEMAHVVLW